MAFTGMYDASPRDPAPPHVPGAAVFAVPLAAAAAGSGCWTDAVVLANGCLALSAGDAAGAAPEIAAGVRAALRGARAAAPADAMRRANAALARRHPGTLVAAIHGVLDPVTLAFTYASAGHAPPFAVDAAGSVRALSGGGTGAPLGAFAHCAAADVTTQLEAGSVLVLAADRCSAAAYAAAAAMPPGAAAIVRRLAVAFVETGGAAAAVALDAALERIDVMLPAHSASAPLARAALRRFLHGVGVPAELGFEIVLAAGEAVANAIEHAYTGAARGRRFAFRAEREPRRIVIEVEDYGRWRSNERTLERGRGLEIMYALADDFAVEETARGTRVRMAFAVQPLRGLA